MLAAGCVVAGTLGLGRFARGEQLPLAGQDGIYRPFKMGLQSYSLRGLTEPGGGRPRQSPGGDQAARPSFLGVVPRPRPDGSRPGSSSGHQAGSRAGRSEVVGYGVVHFGKNADANRRIFEFAKRLGIRYLSADPDPASFDDLDKLVETYDIAVGIHNHGPGHRYEKIETIAKAIKDHHPKIGCCVDTGHFLPLQDRSCRCRRGVRQRASTASISKTSRTPIRSPSLEKATSARSIFSRHWRAIKYNYCLAIEYEENPDNPIADIKACLAEAARAVALVRKA